MGAGSIFELVTGVAATVVNPPTGSAVFGIDAAGGVYIKEPGTPGGVDGPVTFIGYTAEQIQDLIGAMMTDSSELDFTYDDGAGTITCSLIAASIVNSKLADMPQATFKMRAAGAGTGAPIDGTAGQAKTALAIAYADVAGLDTAATQPIAAFDAAGAAAAAQAASQPLDADLTVLAGITVAANTFIARASTGAAAAKVISNDALTFNAAADNAAMRTALGVSIGTSVQAWDADLDALAGQTYALNKIPYFTAVHTASMLDLDLDGTMSANSDTSIPSQKAVRTYVGTAVTGLLDFKGSTDCSTNPNYPAASKGDAYIVSVAGKIGGASGASVDVGDVYFATADNAGGTQGSVGSSWDVLEHNLVGALLSANNLSDVDAATARANLGVTATGADTTYAFRVNNLSDLANAGTALTNLGGTTLGKSYFTLANPSAISFARINADNTVTARSAANFKSDLSLNLVENTALSTWAGSANMITVGALTSGSTGAGFTVALDVATIAGTLANARLPAAISVTNLDGILGANTPAAATVTTLNGNTFTAGTYTLTGAAGKVLTFSNTLTFTGTDASSVAFGAGGTVLYNGDALGTPSSGTLTNATGLPISTGVSGLGAGVATLLGGASSGTGGPAGTTAPTFTTSLTMADGANNIFNATTGTKHGTATGQKQAWWNATPVVQPAGTTDVLASLVTLGLRAASSNPPLDLGTGLLTAGQVNIAGNISAAAWTTAGVGFKTTAATFTDTTSSGTISQMGVHCFGVPTIAASSATTYTNAATVYISNVPTAGTNVTLTNKYSLFINAGQFYAGGGFVAAGGGSTLSGGNVSLNASSNFATNINTGTSTGTVNIGGASATVGFFGVTTSARAAAWTQTYTTTSSTVANPTSATLTDNSAGTANTTLEALGGVTYTTDVPGIRNNFADLAAMVNKLTADVLDMKKNATLIIDQLQAYGLFQ